MSKNSLDTYVGTLDMDKIPHNPNLLHMSIGMISPDRLFNLRYQVVGGAMALSSLRVSAQNNWGANQRYFHSAR